MLPFFICSCECDVRTGDQCTGKQAHLLREGWGDDEMIQTDSLNRHYDSSLFAGYSRAVHTNLARLDESAIDYDLLDELVRHIDTTEDPGAILVFLPGLPEIMNLVDRLNGSHQCAPAPLSPLMCRFCMSPVRDPRNLIESDFGLAICMTW